MEDYEQYIRATEPSRREREENWRTAIGLQAVDQLHTSDYLRETAQRNIEGEISIEEAQSLIRNYYESKTVRTPRGRRDGGGRPGGRKYITNSETDFC